MANPSYVWGVYTNDAIVLPSQGILNVITPPGWTYTIEDTNSIHLRPTTQPVFVGEPDVTFSVLSSSTASTMYSDPLGSASPYAMGLVLGNVFTVPDYVNLAGGYESFAFLGPQVVPEPGVSVLACAGALCLLMRRLRHAHA